MGVPIFPYGNTTSNFDFPSKIEPLRSLFGKSLFGELGVQYKLCYSVWYMSHSRRTIGKDRDPPLIRDPLLLSLLSLIKATFSLIGYYISLFSLIEAVFQRVSKWVSLSFPMKFVLLPNMKIILLDPS